jgi:selenide,water dikinase
VQTVDFFTPIVDDPFLYGQIAATNALSDVYAMGGRPLTALNLIGVPDEVVPMNIVNAILRGGAAKAREAKCIVVGGHSIRNPEPFYGLAVTGVVAPQRLITNANARPGDVLVLTKPLGTGVLTTGIKRGLTSEVSARKAARCMTHLNIVGALVAEKGLVRAGTDVTGFGLLGHLGSMCRASQVGAEILFSHVPLISHEVLALIEKECIPGGSRQNLETAEAMVEWNGVPGAGRFLLADAQTSGGLLLSVHPRHFNEVLRILKQHRTPCAAVIGRVIRSVKPIIRVRV